MLATVGKSKIWAGQPVRLLSAPQERDGGILKPDTFALIIGGMKCGTTSLFELLTQHPQVAGSKVKEPDFFARPDALDDRDSYLRLWDWEPGLHKVALEASTTYTKYPWVEGVPERIAQAPGRFRFIYMVRDPVNRIQSQVRHGLYDGWGKSLDEALTDDLIDFSRYAMQLDRYTALFRREDILVLTLEELKKEPAETLRRVCGFLQIDADHVFTGAGQPRNTGDLYSAPVLVTTLVRNRVLRRIVDHTLPTWARHRLRTWVAHWGRRSKATIGRWQLTPAEIERVRRALWNDMNRLRRHYGVEASWLPLLTDSDRQSSAGE